MGERVVKKTKNQQKWRWQDGTIDKEFLDIKRKILSILKEIKDEPIKTTRKRIKFLEHYVDKVSNGYSEKVIYIDGKKKYIKNKSLLDKQTFAKLLKRDDLDNLIFEYNQKVDKDGYIHSRRIVIRDNVPRNVRFKNSSFSNSFSNDWIEGKSNLCCSIELDDFFSDKKDKKILVVTSYYNLVDDDHSTLNDSRYKNL